MRNLVGVAMGVCVAVSGEARAGETRPALSYDRFREGVELQVASKRQEQLEALEKLLRLGPTPEEAPALLFRLAELDWEESQFRNFEANRTDDQAANGQTRAVKEEAFRQSALYRKRSIDRYRAIIQKYPHYERLDEVLFFMAHALRDDRQLESATVVDRKMIALFPQSKYVPDAWMAVGQALFDSAQNGSIQLKQALEAFENAARYPQSRAYGYALYLQGWCLYNLNDFSGAMARFRAVAALQGEGAQTVNLTREARKDFVLAFSRQGDPSRAAEEFEKVGGAGEVSGMLKGLAGLYFDGGQDVAAVQIYRQMIRSHPESLEAPLFQARIVESTLRGGDRKQTLAQVREWGRIALAHPLQADRPELQEGFARAERTLATLAVSWHQEAKKTRDDATAKDAVEVYRVYLERFPESPKAYELRFFLAELLGEQLQRPEEAAREYDRVVAQDIARLEAKPPQPPGRYFVPAAYAAILAWDEKLKGQTEGAGEKPKEKKVLSPLQIALAEACERYIHYLPKGENRVEVIYKAGDLYYRHDLFEKAIPLLSIIPMEAPENPLAEVSANLVLDSFNLQGNWAELNTWARKFFAIPKLARGNFRAELQKVLEQSAFKLIQQQEEKGDFAAAGEAYLRFADDFPESEIADLSLLNASVDLFKGKQVARSIEVRERLVERYPRSKYLPQCALANGEAFEAIGDFDESAKAYEIYAYGYAAHPKDGGYDETKARIALYNAALFREGLGQPREALKARQRYLELWPEGPDAAPLALSIAALPGGAAWLEAARKREVPWMRSADLQLRVVGASSSGRKGAEKILALYEELSKGERAKLTPEALAVVGEARLTQLAPEFESYRKLVIPSDVSRTKAALDAKQQALTRLQRAYTEVVDLQAPSPAICALEKVGLLYKEFADALQHAPAPEMPLPKALNRLRPYLGKPWKSWPKWARNALPEEEFQKLEVQLDKARTQFEGGYREQLGGMTASLEQKAADAFEMGVTQARELKLPSRCAAESAELLSQKYNPTRFPAVVERWDPLPLGAWSAPSGDLEKIRHEAREALMADPKQTAPFKALIAEYLARGEPGIARLMALRARKVDPEDVELIVAQGLIAAREERPLDAVLLYRSALERASTATRLARLAWARLALEGRDWSTAAEQLAAVPPPANPVEGSESGTIALALGVALKGSARFEEALAAYRKTPQALLAHYDLGLLFQNDLGQPDQALLEYRAYVAAAGPSLKPDDPVHDRITECQGMTKAKAEK